MATTSKKRRPAHGASFTSDRSLKAAAIVGGIGFGMFVAYKAFGGSHPSSPALPSGAGKKKATGTGTAPAKVKATLVPRPNTAAPDVATVQRALVALGGEPARIIAASGGVDGKAGSGLSQALQAAGLPQLANFDKTTYPKLLNLGANALATARRLGKVLPVLGPPVPTPGVPDFVSPNVIQRLVLPVAPAAKKAAHPAAKAKAPAHPTAKAGVKKKPIRNPTPGLTPRPVAVQPLAISQLPTLLSPRPADLSPLRASLYSAVTRGNRNALVGVLQRLGSAADWQALSAVPAGKTPWRDKRNRLLEASIAAQFGAVNNSVAQQFMRLGLRYDAASAHYVSTLG